MNKAEIMTMIEPHSTYVQVMLNRIQSLRELCLEDYNRNVSLFLQEVNTLGLIIPRQQCAGMWLTNEFITRGNGNIVYNDEYIRRNITINYCSIFDVSLNSNTMHRMKTIEDIHSSIDNNIPPHGNFIFINGSRQFFKKIRAGKFYNWLANHVDSNFTIICAN